MLPPNKWAKRPQRLPALPDCTGGVGAGFVGGAPGWAGICDRGTRGWARGLKPRFTGLTAGWAGTMPGSVFKGKLASLPMGMAYPICVCAGPGWGSFWVSGISFLAHHSSTRSAGTPIVRAVS